MLRSRQRLGKYRIEKRIGQGGFSVVYRAYDTIEGIPVALKVPHLEKLQKDTLNDLRREVRISADLDHPNILPIKNAMIVDERFIIAYPLGEGTFADRLKSRMSTRTALDFAEQMLEAVACAHRHRIIHCDIKPENFIMFSGPKLRLSDFGIAKIAQRNTLSGFGTGTLGFVAPEQAFGKPVLGSDVFSLGVVLYRMFSGHLPEWPYEWPPKGYSRVRQQLPSEFINFLARAIEVDDRRRYKDGMQMLNAFKRLKPSALRHGALRKRKRTGGTAKPDWRAQRLKEFKRRFGKTLCTKHSCKRCDGHLSEPMSNCPWCGLGRPRHDDEVDFPARCTRCKRGAKLDWKYCPWCYGKAIQTPSERRYTDVRYTSKCGGCRGPLMPFSKYCPWCRAKVRKPWKLEDCKDKCKKCGWGVLKEFWDFCPWCKATLEKG